jgi:hypothetical protein
MNSASVGMGAHDHPYAALECKKGGRHDKKVEDLLRPDFAQKRCPAFTERATWC